MRLQPGTLAAAVLLSCVTASFAEGPFAAPVAAEHGMVVSAQHLATDVGVDILKHGGNAIDAAVAVGYALAVVYPAAGNIGGGGFMTIQFADGRHTFIDFREKAPLAATANMYLDASGAIIKGLSTDGYLSVAVPGTVSGLEYARAKYGTVPRATLIAPAIAMASDGFVLDEADAAILHLATEAFRADKPLGAIFLNHGEPFAAGERLVQKDLAKTLRRISDEGAAGFYRGPVAAAIVAASRTGKGILTEADFAQYSSRELAPVECDYRGLHVISAPPPSSGGVVVCEILNILEGYPLKELGFHSAKAVHYEIEAMRHAFIDRNTYLGDPDFVRNPVEHLIDKHYAAEVRASIDPEHAGNSALLKPGLASTEGTNTTHYSIADSRGNAVSVTYTLNNLFGARVLAAGTGVVMNDEMDDFTSKPGSPNFFLLVQGETNAIAPGKRPLSSMSPTILTENGKTLMVVGTPGGSRIITTVLQTIINVVDYGMDIQTAVDAPRFHQQWLPAWTTYEPDAFTPETLRTLVDMGQQLRPSRPVNHVAAVLVGAPTLDGKPVGRNLFYGANDPRGGTGLAEGY